MPAKNTGFIVFNSTKYRNLYITDIVFDLVDVGINNNNNNINININTCSSSSNNNNKFLYLS